MPKSDGNLRGVVHGNVIQLETDIGLPDGQEVTVSVRPRGETQLLVRANCQIGNELVQDPVPYQRFFAALSKSLFLEAQQVE